LKRFKNGNYHKEVYLPYHFGYLAKGILYKTNYIKVSRHLKNELWEDYSHSINMNYLLALIGQLRKHYRPPFEVLYINGRVVKACWRLPYDELRDIIVVLTVNWLYKCTFVKTAWLNNKFDRHDTLDKAKYIRRYKKDY